jgi:hypothetical protein
VTLLPQLQGQAGWDNPSEIHARRLTKQCTNVHKLRAGGAHSYHCAQQFVRQGNASTANCLRIDGELAFAERNKSNKSGLRAWQGGEGVRRKIYNQ